MCTVSLASRRSPEHLDDSSGAAGVDLSSDNLQELETAVAQVTIHGARYDERAQKMIDR